MRIRFRSIRRGTPRLKYWMVMFVFAMIVRICIAIAHISLSRPIPWKRLVMSGWNKGIPCSCMEITCFTMEIPRSLICGRMSAWRMGRLPCLRIAWTMTDYTIRDITLMVVNLLTDIINWPLIGANIILTLVKPPLITMLNLQVRSFDSLLIRYIQYNHEMGRDCG